MPVNGELLAADASLHANPSLTGRQPRWQYGGRRRRSSRLEPSGRWPLRRKWERAEGRGGWREKRLALASDSLARKGLEARPTPAPAGRCPSGGPTPAPWCRRRPWPTAPRLARTRRTPRRCGAPPASGSACTCPCSRAGPAGRGGRRYSRLSGRQRLRCAIFTLTLPA